MFTNMEIPLQASGKGIKSGNYSINADGTESASSTSSTNYPAKNAFQYNGTWYPNKTGFPTGEWAKWTFNSPKKVIGVSVIVTQSGGGLAGWDNFIWEICDENDNSLGELLFSSDLDTRFNASLFFDSPKTLSAVKILAKSAQTETSGQYLGLAVVEIFSEMTS